MRGRVLAWLAGSALAIAAIAYGAGCVGDAASGSCTSYCNDVQATCTGDNQQYVDTATCLRFCAAMTPGQAGLAAGDSIECRAISVSSAKDDPSPANVREECIGGGIAGFGAKTTCAASTCAGFCNLDLALCGNTLPGYADVNACIAACATWGQSFSGAVDQASTGNTLQCRMYHLGLAMAGDSASLATHCPHTANASPVCKDTDAGTDGGVLDAAADAPGD
jgi:hypothetical protein